MPGNPSIFLFKALLIFFIFKELEFKHFHFYVHNKLLFILNIDHPKRSLFQTFVLSNPMLVRQLAAPTSKPCMMKFDHGNAIKTSIKKYCRYFIYPFFYNY